MTKTEFVNYLSIDAGTRVTVCGDDRWRVVSGIETYPDDLGCFHRDVTLSHPEYASIVLPVATVCAGITR